MLNVKSVFLAASAIGVATLTACSDGTDLTPGNANIVINTPAPAPSTPSPGTPSPSTPSPSTPAPAGTPQTGSIGNGQGVTRNAAAKNDPFSVAGFFNAAGLGNTTTVVGLIDDTGFPTAAANNAQTGLTGNPFTVPTSWPPATALENNVALPLPDYITSVSYTGAYEPGVARSAQWTAGWTIKVNGNDAVWDFAGGAAGTALASNSTAPVADGTCPAGTVANGSFTERIGSLANDEARLFTGASTSGNYDICTLPRRFGTAGTVRLTNDNVYELAAGFPGTYVGNGEAARGTANFALTAAILDIEAGTVIFGEDQEALVVTRGAQMNVMGTQANPVVMTSIEQLRGRFDGNTATPIDTNRGEWAGLAILGQARDTQCANSQTGVFSDCNVAIEGGVGNYGGDLQNDNSGNVSYLIVRHAGNIIGQDVELNGITFGGVGRASRMNFVQVHRGLDDGIEWFGGSNFIAHAVLTGNDDDNLDGDNGWSGGVQFALIQQQNDSGNRALEMDGRSARIPATFPLLANITAIGPAAPVNQTAKGEDSGVLFREGIRTQVHNSIFTGNFGNNGSCLDLDDGRSNANTPSDTFSRVLEQGGTATAPGPHFIFRNTIVDCPINFTENDERAP